MKRTKSIEDAIIWAMRQGYAHWKHAADDYVSEVEHEKWGYMYLDWKETYNLGLEFYWTAGSDGASCQS